MCRTTGGPGRASGATETGVKTGTLPPGLNRKKKWPELGVLLNARGGKNQTLPGGRKKSMAPLGITLQKEQPKEKGDEKK